MKRLEQEKAIDGLVLTKAIYRSPSTELDVLVPLQVLIIESQLVLPGGKSKAGLLGFFNIDPVHSKTLLLEYTFKGSPHRVELADQEPVMLPARHHKSSIEQV
jgi:DnaJ family protein C protein 11